MRAVALLLPALSFTLLGAHFYRAGAWLGLAACVAGLALLAMRNAWARRVVQAALVLGGIEWLWTAAMLVQQRQALGQPWMRPALILGGVALFTLVSAAALQVRLRRPEVARR